MRIQTIDMLVDEGRVFNNVNTLDFKLYRDHIQIFCLAGRPELKSLLNILIMKN